MDRAALGVLVQIQIADELGVPFRETHRIHMHQVPRVGDYVVHLGISYEVRAVFWLVEAKPGEVQVEVRAR